MSLDPFLYFLRCGYLGPAAASYMHAIYHQVLFEIPTAQTIKHKKNSKLSRADVMHQLESLQHAHANYAEVQYGIYFWIALNSVVMMAA